MDGRTRSNASLESVLGLLLGACALLLIPQSARAAVIPGVNDLQDLIDLGSTGIIVGDKQFYDFQYSKSPANSANSPDASDISVQTTPSPTLGLEFSFGWFATQGINMDSLIRYKVSVLPSSPLLAISDVNLFFNGAAPVTGTATFASITETVRDLSLNVLGQMTVYNDGAGGFPDNNSATLALVPAIRDIEVAKDITINAAPAPSGGVATLSLVDNTFEQIEVPEPAGLALLLGGASIGLLRRRRA